MNNRIISIIGLILLLVVVGVGTYLYMQQDNKSVDTPVTTDTTQNSSDTEIDTDEPVIDTSSYRSEKGVVITVTAPERASKIASPVTITGSVPGSWSHEGQFTIRVLDSNSTIIAEEPATLSGDWMTESPVPFTSTISFEAEAGTMGLIVLVRANPSDLAENSDSLTIPVQF